MQNTGAGVLVMVGVFLILCAFTAGQYYQLHFMLTHKDSVATKQVIDANCVKL